jgi:O-antigen ligase
MWALSGMYGGPLVYGVVPLTMFIFKSRNMYMELLLGFFFILILSDSRQDSLAWAADVKNECIVLLTLFLLLNRKDFGAFNTFYQKFIPFFVIAFICVFYSPSEIVSTCFQKTLSYLFLLLVTSNYALRCHREHGIVFYRTLVYFGMGILIFGLALKYINPAQAYGEEHRFRGLLGNPNGLGVFAVLVFLTFSAIKNTFPDIFTRKENIVFYGSVFLSLLMSDSRNSLFAILIFMFFSYFYKISPFLGFILFLMLGLSYEYITTNLVQIIGQLGLSEYLRVETLEKASGRFVAWSFALDNIRQSVWIGKGFEYTNYIYALYADYLSALGHQGNAHNSYLTLWLDTGLLGLAAYLWAFVSTFFQASKKTKLAFPIMYAIFFSTFFESWLTASLNPFTIQLFLILTVLTSEEVFQTKTQAALLVQ